MAETTRHYPCTSNVKGDELLVWGNPQDANSEVGFQTTEGHTAFLNREQRQNLIKWLAGRETERVPSPVRWWDE